MSSQNSHKAELSKPMLLSPVESYFWRNEENVRGFRVGILTRLDGCIEEDLLAEALENLQRRHPKLQAGIVEGRDRRLRYVFSPVARPIPYEIKDYRESESPWREETRRLLCNSFPAGGPMAAVVVLRNRSRGCSELILAATHAFTDGVSAVMLIDELLAEYAKAEAQQVEVQPQPALPLISAKRARYSGGWRSRLQVLRRFARLVREVGGVRQTVLPKGNDIPALSQWVHWVFSPEDTLRLVRRCRKERASISGAMLAAVCCGIMETVGVSEAFFRWQTPFDIRELLEGSTSTGSRRPVTTQDLGCFMSNMNGFFKLQEQPEFWDLARTAQREIQGFVQTGGPSVGYNLASFFYSLTTMGRLFRLPSRWLSHREERVTVLATNYGVLSMRNKYGSVRPRACTLIFKNDDVGSSLIIESLVLGQELNVGFAADNLDPAFWEALQVAVRRHLDANTDESEGTLKATQTMTAASPQ